MTHRSPITTHVLNTATGKPAVGVAIRLERKTGQDWVELARGVTDQDGRITNLIQADQMAIGHYKMHFDSEGYLNTLKQKTFFPSICIEFQVDTLDQHYHVPLLLSPFGYSTYRGS